MLWLDKILMQKSVKKLGDKVSPYKVIDDVKIYVVTDRELQRKWRGFGTLAVAFGEIIIVRAKYLLDAQLLAHEMEHIRQARTDPFWSWKYTWNCWVYGYRKNPYEVMARKAERRVAKRKRRASR